MRVVMVILVVLNLNAESIQMPPEVIANVSLLLAHYHNVDCLQIFRTDDLSLSKVNTIYGLWKQLAVVESRLTTGVYSYRRYLERKMGSRRKVSCYRSLKIMSDDEGSSQGYAQFSMRLSIKDAIWVLFTDSLAIGFFKDAHIVFNDVIIIAQILAEDVIVFHEVYRVTDEMPMKVLYLGKWTRAGGLELLEESIYERRSDLEGIVLRVASVPNWPASYLKSNGEWDGFLFKLWQEIQALLNCTSVPVERGESLVGVKLSNGSWNGLVGMALRNEIDIIVAEVVIDKERSHALNFLHPITKSNFQIYKRHLGYQWRWAAVLSPLDTTVWVAAVGWVLVGTVSWVFFHRICLSQGLEPVEFEQNAPMRSFFFVLQAMCQQGYHLSPNSYACRVLFFVSYAVSSVLIPSYSASLVSSLSQKIHLKSFDSLQEMVADGTYRLLVKENTAQHTFFAHSHDDFFKLAYEKLVKPVPEEMKKMGLRQSIKSLCYLDKYAVMGVEDIIEGRLHHLVTIDCQIVRLTHPVSTIYLTMATAKHNPFWGLINHHLGKLLMSGTAERLRQIEFPIRYNPQQNSEPEVNIQQVATAFIFIGFCSLASIIILYLEIHVHYFKVRRNRLKRKKRRLNLDLPQSHLKFELKFQQYATTPRRFSPLPTLYH